MGGWVFLSIFETSHCPFSRGILKLINYSTIAQKVLNIYNNDIVVASDRAALRVSVMHWRLEVILSTVSLLKEVV